MPELISQHLPTLLALITTGAFAGILAGLLGAVDLIAFVCIVPLTVLFAPLGAAMATKLNAAKLKQVFALVLLLTGLRMLGQVLLT